MYQTASKGCIFLHRGRTYGQPPPPVHEKSVPKPISPYGASKLACEGYLSAFSEAYGLNTVAFRFANVYGPNSAHKKGVINKYIEALDKGRDLIVYGESVRDLFLWRIWQKELRAFRQS